MSEVTGTAHGVELSVWLWLVPGIPLFAFVVSAYLALVAEPATLADQRKKQLAVWRAGAVAAAVTLLLVRWGHETTQLAHVFRFFRVGRIDGSLDLICDPASLLVAGGIAVASVTMAFTRTENALWAPLLEGGALVAALADNVPTALFGGALASVALTMMADRTFTMHRVSDAITLLGCALLAWALGGGFAGGEFVSDMNPRLVVASTTAASTPRLPMDDDEDDRRKPIDLTAGGKGTLTLASLPGSLVFLDDSKTPLSEDKIPSRAPIVRTTLSAGIHHVRVRPSEGTDDTLLGRVTIATATETRIVLLGPTMSLREADDQLGMKWAEGGVALREQVLAHEAWPGVRLTTLACVALGLGVLLRLFGNSGLVAAGFLVLLARAAPLLAFEPRAAGVLSACAVVAALWSAALAARSPDVDCVLRRAATAKAALVMVGVVTGSVGPGLLDFALSLVALALMDRVGGSLVFAQTVSAPRARSSWSIVWLLGAFTVLASPAQMTQLAGAFSFSAPLAAAAALAMGVLSFALFRAYALAVVPRGPKKKKAKDDARPWLALGGVALGCAVFLGFDARVMGGDASIAARLVQRVIDPRSELAGQGTLGALALVGLGVVLGAASLAHRAFKDLATKEELARVEESQPPLAVVWSATARLARLPGLLGKLAPAEPAEGPEAGTSGALSGGLAVLAVAVVAAAIAVWANR